MKRTVLNTFGIIGVLLLIVTIHNQPSYTASSGGNLIDSSKVILNGLWRVYDQSLKGAKYIDLTHTLTPSIPVERFWSVNIWTDYKS